MITKIVRQAILCRVARTPRHIARAETAQRVITGSFLSLLWNPPVAEFRLKIVEPVTLEVFSDYV